MVGVEMMDDTDKLSHDTDSRVTLISVNSCYRSDSMANLTISVDENLVKQARIKAIQEGTSLSAKVREMLAAYVQQDIPSATVVVPKLPVSKATGGLMPGIDPSSNRSFYEAMEADTGINPIK